jgi:hypothetical protein
MLDIFVAQVGLQRERVVPSVRQCVTAGVPKHVRVHACELGRLSGSRNHLGEASRKTALGYNSLGRQRGGPCIVSASTSLHFLGR